MNNIPIIMLDFDGVILESVDVKTHAFETLFQFVPDHVDEIVDFHMHNGGMSRFDKFRYFYKNILKEPLPDEQYDFLCNRFYELVFEGVLQAEFVCGALEFLESWSSLTSLFIVSATPVAELEDIILHRNIMQYFKGIYGSPRTKSECIEEIMINNNSSTSHTIFVGDALNDYKAAKQTGVRFIGRVNPTDEDIFSEMGNVELVVSDLVELSSYLEELYC
ncbi:HAD-IA family hydrolase [Methanolobus sp. ZRKC5]|uniref:HAD family hydrolase n=1 Tax=unclassified Methanolobus TaxID=2629569 RepID=UPI00313ACBC5